MTWEKRKFAEIVSELKNGGTPSTKNSELWEGNIPWITGADFESQKLARIRRRISTKAVQSSSTNLISKGNLLLVTRTGVGKMAIAPFDVAISQDITGVYFNSEISPDFMLFKLQHEIGYFLRLNQGTSINGITRNDLLEFETTIPTSKTEQKRIAEILATADAAIEQTQALIDKYNRIKRGLMQDLLTRGIDENGNIRSKETHKFTVKNGIEVPVDWEVVKLSDLVDSKSPVVYGILMPGYGYENGIPVIKVKDIINEEINLSDLLLTSPQIANQYKRSSLQTGDLLFTIRGTIGRCAFVPELLNEANITQDTARLRITEISASFVRYCFFLHKLKNYIELNTVGQAVKGINLKELRQMPIPKPSANESLLIANRISQVDLTLKSHRQHLAKFQSIKKGLMQDLLSGKVRVKLER